MSDIGISGVLAQIRALRTQIDGNGGQTPISVSGGPAPFSDALAGVAASQGQSPMPGAAAAGKGGLTPISGKGGLTPISNAIDQVSQAQEQANRLADAFERGDRSTSLAQVMLAMQKAQVSFKAMAEVRNRLVQAYQDIQNMPL